MLVKPKPELQWKRWEVNVLLKNINLDAVTHTVQKSHKSSATKNVI
jgi:hypothetical protein